MSSTAIVPFSLTSPFTDPLKLHERMFKFDDRTIKIQQAWKADGRGGTVLGFGASVYNGSILLAYWLASKQGKSLLANSNVVEVGAGLGLCSLVAALSSPRNIVCTDGDEGSVALAKDNAERNGFGGCVKCCRLCWGDAADIERVRGECLGGGADVLLAADVVAAPYALSIPALIDTIEALLLPASNPSKTPTLLLAYQRRESDEASSEASFFTVMGSRGWKCSLIPPRELHSDFREMSEDRLRPLRLYVFTKQ